MVDRSNGTDGGGRGGDDAPPFPRPKKSGGIDEYNEKEVEDTTQVIKDVLEEVKMALDENNPRKRSKKSCEREGGLSGGVELILAVSVSVRRCAAVC